MALKVYKPFAVTPGTHLLVTDGQQIRGRIEAEFISTGRGVGSSYVLKLFPVYLALPGRGPMCDSVAAAFNWIVAQIEQEEANRGDR